MSATPAEPRPAPTALPDPPTPRRCTCGMWVHPETTTCLAPAGITQLLGLAPPTTPGIELPAGPAVELTALDRDILNGYAAGASVTELAAALDASPGAIAYGAAGLRRKLDATTAAGAVASAFRRGLLT